MSPTLTAQVTTSSSKVASTPSIESFLGPIGYSRGNIKRIVMDELSLPAAESAKRLSEHVEANRRKILRAVLHHQETARTGTIVAELFASNLLDRLVLECETRDVTAFESWIVESNTAEPLIDHPTMILVTFATVSASYTAESGIQPEIVRYLAIRAGRLERAINQARLDRLQARLPEPDQIVAKDDLVNGLLAMLEAHHPASAEHSRAVAAWCERMAKAMGMNEEGVRFIKLCGTLYDIGKLTVPKEILDKPATLSNDEWEIARGHSERGAQILEQIPSLRELAPIVRSHHERYDGLGYPDRIAGDDIPLPSRIIAVADSFHAMISRRPYRVPRSIPQAINGMMAVRGKQFDPLLVDVMISLLKPASGVLGTRVAAVADTTN